MSQLQVTGEAKIRDIQGPVVSNSGVITALDGDASQYVRGDGTLADFPTSTGGGSSVSYYLNSSVSQGTIGGVAYRQLGKTPIIGAGTDITISANGYVASYLTDANDPALLEVPAGNFNCEFYFSVNSNSHNPFVYAEVYKYDGTTFSLIGTSVGVPEYLSNGTTLSPYYFAIPVSQTVLTITDRIAIRIYVNVDGRTVTLHTENGHLCQVVTTFSKGLTSLNNLTRQVQFLGTGTSGTDFNISSATATHTFNLPIASASNTGKLSSTDWSTFNNKQAALSFTAPLDNTSNTISIPVASASVDGYLDNLDWTKFNTAYNDSIISAAVTGTTTKTLTLNQQDGGTITASWTDDNTDAVTSVFGRTGAVVATSGDYNTDLVTEGTTNLYFTNARSRAALSFTAGSGAYNSTTGVITIPTNTNQLTNGASFITLTSLSAGAGISYNNITGVITSTITQYTDALARAAISLTTTGTSGAATYNSTTGVFNIPNYSTDLSGYVPYTGATSAVNLGANSLTARGITVTKSAGISTISFPAGTNDAGFIQHEESTANTGIMRFSVGDDNDANDYFAFGNTGVPNAFRINANGIVSIGTWQGTAIADAYIASAATWNAKQNALTNPVTGTGNNNYIAKFSSTGSTIANSIIRDDATRAYINQENIYFGVDAQDDVRLGLVKKSGLDPTIAYADVPFTISQSSGASIAASNTFVPRLTIALGGAATFTNSITATKGTFSGNTSEPLRIERSAGATIYGKFSLAISASSNFSIYDAVADADRLIISSTGNLGIGVVPSAWESPFKPIQIGTYGQYIAGQTNGPDIKIGSNHYYNASNYIYTTANGAAQINIGGNSGFQFNVADVGVIGAAVTFTQAMSINKNGNVVIGTITDNGNRLQVTGSATFSTSVSVGSSLTVGTSSLFNGDMFTYQNGGIFFAGSGNYNSGIYGRNTGNDLAFNAGSSEKMRITSGGNVGIGTISPARQLSIFNGSIGLYSSSTGQGGTDGYTMELSGTTAYLWNYENDSLIFGTNNTERMRIRGDGGVLINTTTGVSGGGALQVNGNVNINGVFQINGVTIGGGGGSGVTGSGTTNYMTKWTGSTTLGNSIIQDTGTNVGIGAAPLSFTKLYVTDTGVDIIGGNAIAGTSIKGVMVENSNNNDESIGLWFRTGNNHLSGISGQRFNATTGWGTDLRFYTHEAATTDLTYTRERMRITTEGSVLIGTRTDVGSGYKLQVAGSINMSYGGFFNFRGSSGAGDVLVANSGSTLVISGNTSITGTLASTGTITVSTGDIIVSMGVVTARDGFYETSDARAKTLIEDNYFISSIKDVKAKLYKKEGNIEIGYYAQDIKDILPSSVKEGTDGFLSLSYAQVHTAKIAYLEAEIAELKELIKSLL